MHRYHSALRIDTIYIVISERVIICIEREEIFGASNYGWDQIIPVFGVDLHQR